jgi:hypothetical protein
VAEQVGPQLIPAGALVTVPEPVPALVTVSVRCVIAANVAVTLRAAVMLTVQVVAEPEQAPLQPVKLDVGDGAAVSVTDVPSAKLAEQVDGQLMPAGELVTLPDPAPAFVTVRVRCTGAVVKVAATFRAALMVTVHVVALPEQSPDQPAKVELPEAAAVSVTDVPSTNVALQVEGHVIPAGELVTDPVPFPAEVTVSVHWASAGPNVAVTLRAVVMPTVHVVALPEQSPDQPVNVDPAAGAAVSVTDVPLL